MSVMSKSRLPINIVAVLLVTLSSAWLTGCSGPAADRLGSAASGGTLEAQSESAVQKITADEAHELMTSNEVVVLDVRTPEEYAEKHIVNARLLPLDTIDEAAAAEAAPDKDAPVLVYCRTGVRSAEASQKLAALGYKHIYDFGGIVDWSYATVDGADTVQSGLAADQLPVGVKVVCGQTKSLPEESSAAK